MLAVLPLFIGASVAPATSLAPNEVRAPLLVRQTLTRSAGCVSACTTFAKDAQASAGSTSALSSAIFLDAYVECFEILWSSHYVVPALMKMAAERTHFTNIPPETRPHRE
ncbi:hypothetical protein C8J57DRAFT_1531391 [Mycena rebaudengoi]|nr:hypothetical protein C8J57DRAFT_1531391 [Mycena rebaudengoi]